MERHEDAVFALSKLNLDNIEKTIQEAYHQADPPEARGESSRH
jgi:hypothetical protein